MRNRNHNRNKLLSEINVTPLVDVTLTLLLVFMVTAPLLELGIDVNLPQAKGKPLAEPERMNVTLKKDGKIFLNDSEVTLPALHRKLSALSGRNPDVFLRADKDVSYGRVAEVMGEIKDAGIEKLGMVTAPSIEIRK